MSNSIGIMQGRLSPSLLGKQQYFPSETWETEYGLAAELGFASIEWLVDLNSFEQNNLVKFPLLSDKFNFFILIRPFRGNFLNFNLLTFFFITIYFKFTEESCLLIT